MENIGIASVAAITVIAYIIGALVKLWPAIPDKEIPVICGISGAALGLLSLYCAPIPDFPTTDVLILHHAGVTSASPDSIHRTHIGNGWSGIGYHYYIRKDGTIYRGRPEDTVGAHAYGANSHSIGVCFEGNYEVETSMPAAQLAAGQALVADIKRRWGISKVIGHRDVAGATTDCPGKYFPLDSIASGTTETVTTTSKEDKIMVETVMIGNGDRGNAVKSMQGALIAQGYSCGSCGADGSCRKDTWGALLKG